MSQIEKEETKFKAVQTLALCVNNCVFPGSSATKNMCQSCFKSSGILAPPCHSGREKIKSASIKLPERSAAAPTAIDEDPENIRVGSLTPVRQVNRCLSCWKMVGLIGFICRCGDLFCGEHRYSDRHMCGYDYKGVEREAIAWENPMVKLAKIVRV